MTSAHASCAHDGLGAKLLSSLLRVQVGQLTADGLSQELQGCLSDMRLASETLTPGQADLAAAAGNLLFRWQTLLRDAGVQADWQVQLPDSGLPMAPQAALQVLRILQEALNNVLRHARASRVRLHMSTSNGHLKVLVEDNGVGLDAANTGLGRGLRDMGTRAQAVGGQLEVLPAPGGGTQLRLTLPLALGTAAASRAIA
jgi:signal transduction histidine kinase